MMTWHIRADSFFTPAVFWLVYASKARFVLKHKADHLGAVEIFQFSDSKLNFFEAAMTSSLALLGCLLRGITFRHP